MSLDIAVENFKIALAKNPKMRNSSHRISDKEKKQLEEKMEREWYYLSQKTSNKKK